MEYLIYYSFTYMPLAIISAWLVYTVIAARLSDRQLRHYLAMIVPSAFLVIVIAAWFVMGSVYPSLDCQGFLFNYVPPTTFFSPWLLVDASRLLITAGFITATLATLIRAQPRTGPSPLNQAPIWLGATALGVGLALSMRDQPPPHMLSIYIAFAAIATTAAALAYAAAKATVPAIISAVTRGATPAGPVWSAIRWWTPHCYGAIVSSTFILSVTFPGLFNSYAPCMSEYDEFTRGAPVINWLHPHLDPWTVAPYSHIMYNTVTALSLTGLTFLGAARTRIPATIRYPIIAAAWIAAPVIVAYARHLLAGG